jgi:hypothetical protein
VSGEPPLGGVVDPAEEIEVKTRIAEPTHPDARLRIFTDTIVLACHSFEQPYHLIHI